MAAFLWPPGKVPCMFFSRLSLATGAKMSWVPYMIWPALCWRRLQLVSPQLVLSGLCQNQVEYLLPQIPLGLFALLRDSSLPENHILSLVYSILGLAGPCAMTTAMSPASSPDSTFYFPQFLPKTMGFLDTSMKADRAKFRPSPSTSTTKWSALF